MKKAILLFPFFFAFSVSALETQADLLAKLDGLNTNVQAIDEQVGKANSSDAATLRNNLDTIKTNIAAVQVTNSILLAQNSPPSTVVNNTPPVISLIGPNPITVPFGGSYNELYATAFDNAGHDISANIQDNSTNVNSSRAGTYTVTYTVVDSASRVSSATRTVIVSPPTPANTADTTAPVITLNGSTPMTVELNQSYSDPGATAKDNVDGDLTSKIKVQNPVVVSIPGSYSVTYRVEDNSHNSAQAVRVVNVVEPPPPDPTGGGGNGGNGGSGSGGNGGGAISLIGNNPALLSPLTDSTSTGPDTVDKGLVPCGATDPATGMVPHDCKFNDFIVLINKIARYLIVLGASVSVLAFSYAGYLYMTSAGESEKITKAKGIFGKVIIGILVMLSAWLIVHEIEVTFLNPAIPSYLH